MRCAGPKPIAAALAFPARFRSRSSGHIPQLAGQGSRWQSSTSGLDSAAGLIYMSIRDAIKTQFTEGRLRLALPSAPGEAAQRAMFVTDDVWAQIFGSEGDHAWEQRVGRLLADLDVFITGQPIHPKYLYLLFPPGEGVWEIKSVRPRPSIRILGQFAERDVFIVTCIALRERLGGWQSQEWKTARRAAKASWRRLFPSYDPLTVTDVHAVVSGAIDGKYFK